VYWKLKAVHGFVGALTPEAALAGEKALMNADRQIWRNAPVREAGPVQMLDRLEPLLGEAGPLWLALPHAQWEHRNWWRERLGERAEIGFGRGYLSLAMAQLNRLGEPGRILAINLPQGKEPGLETVLALDWEPSGDTGFEWLCHGVEGQFGQPADMSIVLDQAREVAPAVEAVICPGNGQPGYLDRVMESATHLQGWVGQHIPWQFPECPLMAPMGVPGSLFAWAWLESGYRLRDFEERVALFHTDSGPVGGVSVVSWSGGPVGKR